MANKIRAKLILRLRAAGHSRNSIAKSQRMAKKSGCEVFDAADELGVAFSDVADKDDAEVYAMLFPGRHSKESVFAEPDWEYVHKELGKVGVTLDLLHDEYAEQCAKDGGVPMSYTTFWRRYGDYIARNSVTSHIERKAGRSVEVDWSGPTMSLVVPATGEVVKVYLFVASLSYSRYDYVEPTLDMKQDTWLLCHAHMFDFFGAVVPRIIPDNLKQGIVKNTVEELVVNDQYRRMAEYYGCAIVPARPRRPRDKGAVEMGVRVVEQSAMAPLRDRLFTSLAQLNEALDERVREINARPFQKREGSRDEVFIRQEKPLLVPLPGKPYEMVVRKAATVQFNYHVAFDGFWYSVPFSYARREVEVCATKSAVWFICDGERIAMHRRLHGPKGSYSTNPEHMPDSHRDFAEWDGDRFRKWAREVGPACEGAIDAILRSRKVEQQAYRSCRAVLALAKKHGDALLEQACAKALSYSPRPSYKTIKSLIAKMAADIPENPDDGAYLRGNDYYQNLDAGDDE